MAGLVPAIDVLLGKEEGVDARPKAGHDAERLMLKPERAGLSH